MLENDVVEARADASRAHGDEGGIGSEGNGGAAKGAAGVGSKPYVYAFDVESVAAEREGAEPLAVVELKEADCAVPIRRGRLLRF